MSNVTLQCSGERTAFLIYVLCLLYIHMGRNFILIPTLHLHKKNSIKIEDLNVKDKIKFLGN